MPHRVFSKLREPLIGGHKHLADITAEITATLERKPSLWWWLAFLFSGAMFLVGAGAVAYEFTHGVGTWGLNKTVGWGFDITNFVFWIGIGHAGTFISAILFLLGQRWRTSVNRAAEAMTIFAVICALLFPLIHLGRPWYFFWMAPYPNVRGSLWVNFRSPLIWDFIAITTYFLISLTFWYVGLIPDLATIREKLRSGLRQKLVSFFSLGWNGSAKSWHRHRTVYIVLASLATPLVISVHSIVSMDFATGIIPGWHSTIFPPYFVAGAIFSGMAMVLTLMLVARKTMGLENYITQKHIDPMCYLLIAMGSLVGLAYFTEIVTAFYSGDPYEQFITIARAMGPWAALYWIMLFCNIVSPHFLWFTKLRRNLYIVFLISILVNIGMWLERFIIIAGSLQQDFLPSSWASYMPTKIEVMILLGSFGLFFSAFLLFCRLVPVIAISEVKSILSYGRKIEEGDAG